MKRLTFAMFALAAAAFASPAFGAEAAARAGFEYDYWKDSRGNRGTQALIPIRVDTRFENLSLGLLTAAARTTFDPDAGADRSLTAFLDTKVVTSYEIVGRWPVDVLVGLDLNVPTGKTDLSAADAVLVEDPELVTVTSLGEGFNVNPTVIAAKAFGPYVAGVGVGYDWRGKYDFSKELGLADFKPGDVWTVSATVRRDLSPATYVRLFGNATRFGKQEAGGVPIHKEGNFYLAGIEGGNASGRVATLLRLRAIFRQKSEFLGSAGALSPESSNSHGNEYRADLSADFAADRRTVLKATLQGLWIAENGYPSDSMFFAGAKKKAALGLGASRRLTDRLEGEFLVKGFVMKEDEARFPQFRAARTDRGGSALIALTSRF